MASLARALIATKTEFSNELIYLKWHQGKLILLLLNMEEYK